MNSNKNNFALASIIVGMLSITLICSGILPLPLGALGILFAILSYRKGRKLSALAIGGIATSLVGILSGIMLFVGAFQLLLPENRDQLNSTFEQIYGVDFDTYFENIYGSSMEDYFNSGESY